MKRPPKNGDHIRIANVLPKSDVTTILSLNSPYPMEIDPVKNCLKRSPIRYNETVIAMKRRIAVMGRG